MSGALVILAGLLVAAMVCWRRGAHGATAAFAVGAALPAWALARQLPWPALVAKPFS